jgi:hypothetical protein
MAVRLAAALPEQCEFHQVGVKGSRIEVHCHKCGTTMLVGALPVRAACRYRELKIPGVGDHLADVVRIFEIARKEGCGCDEMIAQMNAWGIDGCREHRAEIVEHLQKNYKRLTWAEVAAAARSAIAAGLVRKLKPRDVCGSLVDLAITRAQAAISSTALHPDASRGSSG